ncbi:5-methylcytosine restriction system specificity protein McrC [Bifidobacterium thermophilum]|uniref:3-isopropylmalate dehydrogenase n=1 Tax=Bifidobacterium thermophilum TaxID=33905 RepID=A0A7X9NS89_9BIFI|nr:3-isopropylmalate dehydrogenase [Bifidobacterium thermophilum]NME62860.1 3-isopropylmalate dehydrogenase [Bifidobacterium thermophilum]
MPNDALLFLLRDNNRANDLFQHRAPRRKDTIPVDTASRADGDGLPDIRGTETGAADVAAGADSFPQFLADTVEFLRRPVYGWNAEHPGVFVFPPSPAEYEDMDKNQAVLRYGYGEAGDSAESSDNGRGLWTSNLVGLLHFENAGTGDELMLSIASRFFSKDGESPVSFDQDFLLAYLMDRVLHFNLLDLDFASSAGRSDLWRQLLMLLFPMYLERATAKGVYRQYVRREHNDMRPRGSINVPRHIAENTPFRGTIAYSTREYDEDNPVTELVRHTVEYIGLHSPILRGNRYVKSAVQEIRRATDEHYDPSERRKLIQYNRTHPVRHPYYAEYRDLQRLCLLILTRRGFENEKREDSVHGILVDCAWLWEEYLNIVLGEAFSDSLVHPQNKTKVGKHHLFTNIHSGKLIGEIYPDFLLHDRKERPDTKYPGEYQSSDHRTVVLDAKYKPIGNVSGRDYLQVVAYMLRFDATDGVFLHIADDNTETDPTVADLQVLMRPGFVVHKIGMPVMPGPDERHDYPKYCEHMKIREQAFIAKLRRIIQ